MPDAALIAWPPAIPNARQGFGSHRSAHFFTRRVEWSRRICLVALNAILQSAERHLDPTCVRPARWRHARRHLRCRPRCLFLAVGPRPLPFWRDRSAFIRRQRHNRPLHIAARKRAGSRVEWCVCHAPHHFKWRRLLPRRERDVVL